MGYWARLILGLAGAIGSSPFMVMALRSHDPDRLTQAVLVVVFMLGLILLVGSAITWSRFRRRRQLQRRGLEWVVDAKVDLATIRAFGRDPDEEPRTYAICADRKGLTAWVDGADAEPIATVGSDLISDVRASGLIEPGYGAGQVHMELADGALFALEAVGPLLGLYSPSPAGTDRIAERLGDALGLTA